MIDKYMNWIMDKEFSPFWQHMWCVSIPSVIITMIIMVPIIICLITMILPALIDS